MFHIPIPSLLSLILRSRSTCRQGILGGQYENDFRLHIHIGLGASFLQGPFTPAIY